MRGYGYRNCTDWAAFRVPQLVQQNVPWGWGNAKNWDNAAQAAGKTVDATPEPGDIAVWEDGTYGHVAVVESINPLVVSEYNGGQDGNYRTRTNPAGIDHYIDLNGPERVLFLRLPPTSPPTNTTSTTTGTVSTTFSRLMVTLGIRL